MSIEKMISEHPQVGADFNEALAKAVRHAMYCAAICNSCADACSAEEMDMRQCIRTCSDCSDVCEATYRVATRRTGDNRAVDPHDARVLHQRLRDLRGPMRKARQRALPPLRANVPRVRRRLPPRVETLNDEVHADGEVSQFEHGAA